MAVTAINDQLEALYRAIGPKLWRSLLAYGGDPEVASDALAEAFAQAISRGNQVRSPEQWIWKAAFRIATGELARRRVPLPDQGVTTYDIPVAADHIVTALRGLPTNQRIAVVMHDYADRSNKEVAEVLGVSSGTVHVHLSRGRARLRQLLEDHDD